MSDCIQLIAHFVSLHFCIFSAGIFAGSLQETCLTGQLTTKKFTVGASLLAKSLSAPLFYLEIRVGVELFREQARSYRGLKSVEFIVYNFFEKCLNQLSPAFSML
ncbi:hypothetical protein [Pseudomonas sp. R2-60-08W]|uniref:hypothetical protein n=1 Tax=Pseudomonas sp. R2-60-08W TaxID=1173280 RepID=UPI0013DDA619|nr:hypothetical protein [Pseudomonas sp. R2-60-08W]